jgi:acyl-CoA synthetase (NDP forming)
MLAYLRAKGIPSSIVISAGFREAGQKGLNGNLN